MKDFSEMSEKEELEFYRSFHNKMNAAIYVLNQVPYKVDWISDNDCVKRVTGPATDNCGVVTLSQQPLAGTPIVGCDVDLTVKIYATDDSGNVDSCEIHVFTSDLLICPVDNVVYVDQSSTGLIKHKSVNIGSCIYVFSS